MTVGKTMRAWIRASQTTITVGILAACVTPVSAQVVDKLQRVGRLQGFGWGDGYHTCSPSGIRLGADLPPKSNSVRRLSHFRESTSRLGHRVGSTFYDRFDAANGRACECGANCDSGCCDAIPMTSIQSSQVTLGPDGIVTAPANRERPLEMNVASQATQTSPPADLKRPIRPQAPETIRPRSISIATPQPDFGFPLPPTPDDSPTEPTSIAATASSATPVSIEPVHPYELTPPRPKQVVAEKTADVQPKRATDSAPVSGVPSYAMGMASPTVKQPFRPEPVAAGQPKPQSYALPERKPQPIAATKPQPIAATKPQPIAAQPPRPQSVSALYPTPPRVASAPPKPSPYALPPRDVAKRPARIGMTPVSPAPTESAESIAQRPSRIGFSGDVKVNPFASRPVVELAEQTAGTNEGVIYQPSGGSLK